MNNQNSTHDICYHNFKEEINMRSNIENHMIANMVKDERMERIMKTGVIAAGAATAAGLALGMSPVAAHAAEPDMNGIEVQANAETGVPETTAEAEKAVETAQANVESTDAAVEDAQDKVDDAQVSVNTAAEAAETARSEADYAFEEAKSEAAEADAAASKEVEAAERKVDEAQGMAQQASEEAAAAQEIFEDAENSAREAVSEATVTEEDIFEKENEHAGAETDLVNAGENLVKAEMDRNEAAAEAERKEEKRNDAENVVRKAETERSEAEIAASAAEDAADQADKELQSAENLKNGTEDIKETVQYRKEQEAKEMMGKASEAAYAAAEETDKAYEKLEHASAAVNTAERELDTSIEKLKEREKALSEAGKAKKDADRARKAAQAAYDSAAFEAAGADVAVSEAEEAVAGAREDVNTAQKAKNMADHAVETASNAVDKARQDAEAAVIADIAAAEQELADKLSVREAAQEDLDATAEKYKKGTLGLIDWMLEAEGLTKDQKQDLTFAREVLVNASEEDFSRYYGGQNNRLPEERNDRVIVIGDERDASNLENLLKSIEIMKKINDLRASDDNYTGDMQRNDSYTNFFLMATAEAGAMRGAGYRRHTSLTTSCENLAFGYSDPTLGWYNKEKTIFDGIKEELGITEITSAEDVDRIEKEACYQGLVVGHYTNLFWAADQVMGVGYTQYRETSCYNASKASNYTNDQYNRAMHLYTIEEFERLVTDYYKTVDKGACEKVLETADIAKSEAETRLQNLLDNKESNIEKAIGKARTELAARESDAETASQTLTKACEALAEAEKAIEESGTRKLSADQVLQIAMETLRKAVEESNTADTDFAYAEKDNDEARRGVVDAESDLKEAMAVKAEAASALEKQKEVLAAADAAFDKASLAYSEAERKLAALTSDKTLAALREKKQLADAALQTARDNKAAKDKTLEQAEEGLTQAEKEAADAMTVLKNAESRLLEAIRARDKAKEEAALTAAELENVREQYAPVLRAIAARDAARENLIYAESIRKAAESNLGKAQAVLEQAQMRKAMTADRLQRITGLCVEDALKADIADPEYAYLNEYVSAIKFADVELDAARTVLQTANAELAVRKTESEKAQKEYIEAVANFAVIQDHAETRRSDQEQSQALQTAAETTDSKEVIVPVMNGEESGPADSGAAADKVGPVLTKEESAGREYSTDPVATGDTSNAMVPIAEFLASAGLMAVACKRRREAEDKTNQ